VPRPLSRSGHPNAVLSLAANTGPGDWLNLTSELGRNRTRVRALPRRQPCPKPNCPLTQTGTSVLRATPASGARAGAAVQGFRPEAGFGAGASSRPASPIGRR
jgi:hypothetical protein